MPNISQTATISFYVVPRRNMDHMDHRGFFKCKHVHPRRSMKLGKEAENGTQSRSGTRWEVTCELCLVFTPLHSKVHHPWNHNSWTRFEDCWLARALNGFQTWRKGLFVPWNFISCLVWIMIPILDDGKSISKQSKAQIKAKKPVDLESRPCYLPLVILYLYYVGLPLRSRAPLLRGKSRQFFGSGHYHKLRIFSPPKLNSIKFLMAFKVQTWISKLTGRKKIYGEQLRSSNTRERGAKRKTSSVKWSSCVGKVVAYAIKLQKENPDTWTSLIPRSPSVTRALSREGMDHQDTSYLPPIYLPICST